MIGHNNLDELCTACVSIAQQAGKSILEIYEKDFAVQKKEDDSPLTEADLAAHNIIVDALTKLTPDIPILSEESAALPFSERKQWQTYWLVDPLDGTREFIKRNGEFTVNIALIHKHKSVLGVIHAPVINTDYYAWLEGGAFKNSKDTGVKKIGVKKLDISCIHIAGSRSHGAGMLQDYLKNLGHTEVISMGSSLKFCLVAEGKADIYPRLGLTSEWDSAAAHCIVEQAGGYVTKTDMSPLLYNTKESLLNPHFFAFGDNSRDWSSYLP